MNRYIFYRWLGLYIDHWLYHDISSSPNDLPISDEPRTCILGGSWEDSRTKAVTAVRRDVGKRVKMVVILWDFLWDLYWNFLWFLWDFYGITYFSMGFSCELRKVGIVLSRQIMGISYGEFLVIYIPVLIAAYPLVNFHIAMEIIIFNG